jgi:hypothetical protein
VVSLATAMAISPCESKGVAATTVAASSCERFDGVNGAKGTSVGQYDPPPNAI